MSVLIEGIEMPKDRPQLLWVYPNGKALTVQSDVDPWKELQAVPVPEPHGDLIDRDAARESIKPWSPEDERNGCTLDTVKKLMHTMLDRAPTVIPASEE